MFARYFCIVDNNSTDISDLSFAFFIGLKETKVGVRVIATNLVDLNASKSRWRPYGKELAAPVPNRFTNIVCGMAPELRRLWTAGVRNVAVIPSLKDIDLSILESYNLVLCPDAESVQDMKIAGLNAQTLKIEIEGDSWKEYLTI